MKVWYYRPAVFETNSSSSHALVWCFDEREDVSSVFDGFHWDWFLLRSPQWKLAYFAAQIYESGFPPDVRKLLLSSLFTTGELVEILMCGTSLSVDHQSVWPTFVTPQGEPAFEFYREIKEFLLLPQVAVRGGNDNSPLVKDFARVEEFPWFVYEQSLQVVRNGNYWVVFSPETGRKWRVTFGKVDKLEPAFPESIDLKICSYCPRECPWCYESSGRNGGFAPLEKIVKFFDSIQGKVVEVALGGGEPLCHPQIVDVVREASRRSLSVCITTHAPDKLKELMGSLRSHVSAFGLSITSMEDLEAFESVLDELTSSLRGYAGPQFVFHVVEGITPLEVVHKIFERYQYRPVLVLGFKPMGRAAGMKIRPWEEQDLKDGKAVLFDTYFVKEHPWVLKNAKPEQFAGWDGEFTIAVDLMEDKVGPASYMTMRPLRGLSDPEEPYNPEVLFAIAKKIKEGGVKDGRQ